MNFGREIRSKKHLGQVFLVNPHIAEAEAAHAYDKVVLEIGPGTGILTKELCKVAKKVIAVEKDESLCEILKSEILSDNFVLINKDFLETTDKEIEMSKIDIVIANIPYNLSSSIIDWLRKKRMQAVLCLQKEFVEHMLAKPDTHNYTKLSVMTSLLFRVNKIVKVPKGNFRPIPRVDSIVIYLKPLPTKITERQIQLISLMMQHKKKTIRNAIIDSRTYLGLEKERLSEVTEKIPENHRRVFKLGPSEILKIAVELEELLK